MLGAMRRILAETEIRFIQRADPSRRPAAVRRERRQIYFEYLFELSKELSAIQAIRFANTGAGAWTFSEVNRDGLRMRRVLFELRALGCLHLFRVDVGDWCATRIDELNRLVRPGEAVIPFNAAWQRV
jgi:hypothetical protein